jgi:hypothetical protein
MRLYYRNTSSTVTVDVMRAAWGPPMKETLSAQDHSLYLSIACLILTENRATPLMRFNPGNAHA